MQNRAASSCTDFEENKIDGSLFIEIIAAKRRANHSLFDSYVLENVFCFDNNLVRS